MSDAASVKEDGTAGLPEEIKHEPVGPMIGVVTIALNLALKYHDINTVQDGTLKQAAEKAPQE